MSYILEALEKSRQARELGQVPTLQTPSFIAEEEVDRPNPWILSAVLLALILAATAVVIALYSVVRDRQEDPGPAQATAATPGSPIPGYPIAPPQPPHDRHVTTGTSRPAAGDAAVSAPLAPPSRTQDPSGYEVDVPPLFNDHPPDMPAIPGTRQPSPPEPRVESQDTPRTKIPPDLIADIEAFKREVSAEETGAGAPSGTGAEVAPEDLKLPKDLQGRLPAFDISAHIYDREPAKRFLLINGLKTKEGEETWDGIVVERILPEGAVLSFDGQRFFQRRR